MNKSLKVASIVGLAVLAGLGGWLYYVGSSMGIGWAGLAPVWLYVVAGAVLVGALAAVLMWLAFYSSRRGYDEPYDVNHPRGRKR
jgi:cation transporter-like permease